MKAEYKDLRKRNQELEITLNLKNAEILKLKEKSVKPTREKTDSKKLSLHSLKPLSAAEAKDADEVSLFSEDTSRRITKLNSFSSRKDESLTLTDSNSNSIIDL